MSYKVAIFRLLLLNILLLLIVACKKQVSNTKDLYYKSRPNIVFILADDLGYGDVGFNGQTKINTPNLNKMADDGIIFTRHYAGSTVCGPSRASLMTGLHTGHSPVRGNPRWTKSGTPVDLSMEQNTVAKELRKAGYRTGIVGKWGLAENLDEGKPGNQGFDYFYGFNRHGPAHHYYPEKLWENDSLIKITGNVMKDKKGKYSQNLFTGKALDFIDREAGRPFFLYLAYTIPHFELTIPEQEKQDYQAKDWPLRKMKMGHYRHDENGHVTYASMVTKMDSDIGKIYDKLEEMGVSENTLVIFTSDNGHEYDDLQNEFFNSNSMFRGRKRDLYEGGIRMPFVATWPEKIQPGTKNDNPSAFWDFLPTVCDIVGATPLASTDGISYLPSLVGDKQKQHDYLYWEFNEKKGPIQAVLKDEWKLLYFVGQKYEFYNLEEDPSEENDLYTSENKEAQILKELLITARDEHPEFPLEKRARHNN